MYIDGDRTWSMIMLFEIVCIKMQDSILYDRHCLRLGTSIGVVDVAAHQKKPRSIAPIGNTEEEEEEEMLIRKKEERKR